MKLKKVPRKTPTQLKVQALIKQVTGLERAVAKLTEEHEKLEGNTKIVAFNLENMRRALEGEPQLDPAECGLAEAPRSEPRIWVPGQGHA